MEIEKNKIYVNRNNGKFIHVKEVTCYGQPYGSKVKTICAIATGAEAQYKNDAITNVLRKVFDYNEFIKTYKEYVEPKNEKTEEEKLIETIISCIFQKLLSEVKK